MTGVGGLLGQAGKALIHNTLCAKVERNQGCVIKGNQSHRETFKDLSFFVGGNNGMEIKMVNF